MSEANLRKLKRLRTYDVARKDVVETVDVRVDVDVGPASVVVLVTPTVVELVTDTVVVSVTTGSNAIVFTVDVLIVVVVLVTVTVDPFADVLGEEDKIGCLVTVEVTVGTGSVEVEVTVLMGDLIPR